MKSISLQFFLLLIQPPLYKKKSTTTKVRRLGKNFCYNYNILLFELYYKHYSSVIFSINSLCYITNLMIILQIFCLFLAEKLATRIFFDKILQSFITEFVIISIEKVQFFLISMQVLNNNWIKMFEVCSNFYG